MNKKTIIIVLIALGISAAGYFLFATKESIQITGNKTEMKQLWTCGMHPEIIMEEPGNCPICGMKLVPKKGTGKTTGERKILYWRAPMDPNEIYDHPGKSKMGMELVPVYEDEAGSSGIVTIDPAVVQNMNVKTEKVKSMKLSNIVVTNGILTTNEQTDYIVTTRVNGWIDKLYINYTGQKVNKGDRLMDIYSPELVAAQQELLSAIAYKKAVSNTDINDILDSGDMLIKNAIRKLQLLEISDSDIKKLIETKEVKTYATLYAQKNGTVISKNILEGQKVMPGMPLLHISDLSLLWLTADIYEYELSKIQLGSKAEIRFNFLPDKTFTGKISFIYPTVEPKTRTAKLRIDIPNKNDLLKPAMLANVTIYGKDLGVKPVVPENAVIRSGKKDIVIIALGEGKFKPQEIKLGGYSDGYYQVLHGLTEGTTIVTSAQFLIDSESNLRAAVNQFTSGTSEEINSSHDTTTSHNMKSDAVHNFHSNDNLKNVDIKNEKKTESIIREGIIDLTAIDKNKDGKVYQDLMDWNVISDEPGRCPICNMYLSEVTIREAKQNLIEHGFQVK
ncbi:efflux RND transporter periplasmic adaptor subunit [Melioribacter sp. OK-6-Me]|uniref:efflux RND transporter periplasmic adaptor subunit n=1 Tax=unclassified Melioribacter TaxID=2627329 RepID=UPI003EDB517D